MTALARPIRVRQLAVRDSLLRSRSAARPPHLPSCPCAEAAIRTLLLDARRSRNPVSVTLVNFGAALSAVSSIGAAGGQ